MVGYTLQRDGYINKTKGNPGAASQTPGANTHVLAASLISACSGHYLTSKHIDLALDSSICHAGPQWQGILIFEQGAHSWLGLAWIWQVQQCVGLLAAFTCSLFADVPCLFWQEQRLITMSTCRVAHMMWAVYLDMLLELLAAIEDLQHSQCPCQDTRLPMNHTCIDAHLSASHLHLRMILSS